MIPIAELERFVGASSGDDTTLLIDLEAAAVQWFESTTRRYFGALDSETVYRRGRGKRDLYLPEPVDSVTSVHEQLYPGDDQEEIVAGDDDGFTVRDMHLVRKGGHVWSKGYEYVVVYVRGYTEDAEAEADVTPADIAVPDDVRNAVKSIVGHWYAGGQREAAAAGLRSESIGDYSYTRAGIGGDGLLDAVSGLRETVRNYQIPRF